MRWLDDALGLGLAAWTPPAHAVPDAVAALLAARTRAREERRWRDADDVRRAIEAQGFAVRDTPAGPVVEPMPAGPVTLS